MMRWTRFMLLIWTLIATIVIYFSFHGKYPSRSNYIEIQIPKLPKLSIYVREKRPLHWNVTVVLLHGSSFESSVWERTFTISSLYSKGYRVIAIDLPGHGRSSKLTPPPKMATCGLILSEILMALDVDNCVLVSPSMSGTYSLPVVLRGDFPLAGFVPVAVNGTEQFSDVEYALIHIPTYIIYGEGDTGLGEKSFRKLHKIAGSKVYRISHAGHACYLQKPGIFNRVLLSFLKQIQARTFYTTDQNNDIDRQRNLIY